VGVGARAPLYKYIKFSSKLTNSRRGMPPPPPPYLCQEGGPREGGRGRRISVKFVKNLTHYRACKGAKPGRTGKIVKFKKKLKVDGGLKIGVGDKTSTNIQELSKQFPRTFQELSKNIQDVRRRAPRRFRC
jgi:hypothetical protein